MSEEALRAIALQVRNWALGIPLDRNGPQSGTRARFEIPAFRNLFHVVAIPNMGPEELAADSAADGRHAFLLVAPPLPITRAVGTPINPYALK